MQKDVFFKYELLKYIYKFVKFFKKVRIFQYFQIALTLRKNYFLHREFKLIHNEACYD